MIEIPSLEASTRLMMRGRGQSPELRMRLCGEDLERISACLLKNARIMENALQGVLDGSRDPSEVVSMYREVIDCACGEGASGKVVKWMAGGDRLTSEDLAYRLSPVVGWVCDEFSKAVDGVPG